MKTLKPFPIRQAAPPIPKKKPVEVVVKDFDMPFLKLVNFMLKIMLATLPAAIAFTIIIVIVVLAILAVF